MPTARLIRMAGLLGVTTSFAQRKLHLGYRTARLLADGCLGRAGTRLRGHEFHYASIETSGDDAAFAQVSDAYGGNAGSSGRPARPGVRQFLSPDRGGIMTATLRPRGAARFRRGIPGRAGDPDRMAPGRAAVQRRGRYPTALIEHLLDLAQLSPSVGNSQPWRWVRVDSPGRARRDPRQLPRQQRGRAARRMPGERARAMRR